MAIGSHNFNPTGRGGLGDRPWDRYRIGEPGFPTCKATSKRSGKRCKMPPLRGSEVCIFHGARGGRGKWTLPKNRRMLWNKEIKAGRAMAEAELDRRIEQKELNPETRKAFRTFVSRVHPADQGRLMLALDDRLNGSLSNEAWRETRKLFGL
jgi:hypothetical protein